MKKAWCTHCSRRKPLRHLHHEFFYCLNGAACEREGQRIGVRHQRKVLGDCPLSWRGEVERGFRRARIPRQDFDALVRAVEISRPAETVDEWLLTPEALRIWWGG